MRTHFPPRLMPSVALALALGFAFASPLAGAWYKGNTHAHTSNSDGDSAPEVVARWFHDHGYHFVVISDHDVYTDVGPLNKQLAEAGKFLVIPGVEVTQMLADPVHSAAHINGINVQRLVEPFGAPRKPLGRTAPPGFTPGRTFERNAAAIRDAGGLPQVNHPNFKWSLQPADLLALPDRTLLEIWNGYPWANNLGGVNDEGEKSLSTEELWDAALSRGKVLWAVGADDSHHYSRFDDPTASQPGRAWVVVRAGELSAAAITAALERGDFYASTGVTLAGYDAGPERLSITIQQNEKSPARFVTMFTGREGKVLARVNGTNPVYRPKGDEGYVRATITDSNGQKAWLQPVFLDGRMR